MIMILPLSLRSGVNSERYIPGLRQVPVQVRENSFSNVISIARKLIKNIFMDISFITAGRSSFSHMISTHRQGQMSEFESFYAGLKRLSKIKDTDTANLRAIKYSRTSLNTDTVETQKVTILTRYYLTEGTGFPF